MRSRNIIEAAHALVLCGIKELRKSIVLLDSYTYVLQKTLFPSSTETNKLTAFKECVFLQVITELKLNDKKDREPNYEFLIIAIFKGLKNFFV